VRIRFENIRYIYMHIYIKFKYIYILTSERKQILDRGQRQSTSGGTENMVMGSVGHETKRDYAGERPNNSPESETHMTLRYLVLAFYSFYGFILRSC
jgi:hypothetical protein